MAPSILSCAVLALLVMSAFLYVHVDAQSTQFVNVTVGSLGVVTGFQNTENSVVVNTFTGIPYAQKPERFQPPKNLASWPNSYVNATQLPNSCMQPDGLFTTTQTSEDCLYLNIWAPNAPAADGRPRAVQVFIYGGVFLFGTSTNKNRDGTVLAAYGDVIFVSLQYRVGVMGFLFLNTTDVPGNAGLFDQQMALQWVHDNIQYFGGDPNRVSLFGQSAGAMSCGLQLLSPLNKGKNYFQRAIMDSGSGTTPTAFYPPDVAIKNSMNIIRLSSCANTVGNMTALAACLKQADPVALTSIVFGSGFNQSVLIGPTIDNKFLTDTPTHILLSNNFTEVDGILLGVNANEGSFVSSQDIPAQAPQDGVATRNMFVLETQYYIPFSPLVQKATLFEYTEPESTLGLTSNYRQDIADFISDYLFVCPNAAFCNQYASRGNNVYKYFYTHRSSKSKNPEWMTVSHGDELDYVFGVPISSRNTVNYTADEQLLSKTMVVYWTNFVKTGNPNLGSIQPSVQLATWPKYTNNTQMYLNIEANNYTTGQYLHVEQCTFWNQYAPQLAADEASLMSLIPPPNLPTTTPPSTSTTLPTTTPPSSSTTLPTTTPPSSSTTLPTTTPPSTPTTLPGKPNHATALTGLNIGAVLSAVLLSIVVSFCNL